MAETTNTAPAAAEKTSRKRVLTGVVTSAKSAKTLRVEVARREQHPKYGKFIKKRTVCYVHDENNEARMGDTVDILESRPLSKLKRWALIRIVIKAPTRTVANLEGAVPGSQLAEATGAVAK